VAGLPEAPPFASGYAANLSALAGSKNVPAEAATPELTPSASAARTRLSGWWWPWSWWAALKLKWAAGKPLTKPQRRAFAFWVPVGLVFGAVELAGALSGAFRNFIP